MPLSTTLRTANHDMISKRSRSPLTFVCLAATATIILTVADEGDNNPSLPASLFDKVQRLLPGTTIHKVERDDADGEKRWEIYVRPADSKLETKVKLLEDTTVTEIEEDVAPENLPPAVLQSILKTFPNAKIDDAMRRHRVEITYRVDIEDAKGKEKEIRLTRHGKIRSVKKD